MSLQPLTVVDIFCGAGGLSAGFKTARLPLEEGEACFKLVYGLDNDRDAIETFRDYHFPTLPSERREVVAPCKSIAQVTAQDILDAIAPHPHVDVLIGGPNCQGVSAAGLRNPQDERNEMLIAFVALVRALQPSWFIMENVPGLTHDNNRDLLGAIFEAFESIEGYTVRGDVLLAANYGVAQLRYRLFVIGTNTSAPIRFPPATHGPGHAQDGRQRQESLPPYRTVWQTIGDLEPYTVAVYDEDSVPDENAEVDGVRLHNHYNLSVGTVNTERITNVPAGRDWRSMPIRLLPERYFATRASDQKGAYGRLHPDWPAYTITNETSNVTAGPFTHPTLHRGVSVREAARLQSFADDHIFHGRVFSQYRQVGNAVPPKLAEAVARAILFCHYCPDKATDWGMEGRLSGAFVRQTLDGAATFPTMTPRHINPLFHQPSRRPPARRTMTGQPEARPSVWDAGHPLQDPRPEETELLRHLAQQPGNYRAAKRAKAIVDFISGIPKADIVRNANVSQKSVKKWVDNYFEFGLDGWRAYHTSAEQIANRDTVLRARIEQATTRVRQIELLQTHEGAEGETAYRRLYMNDYLRRLIRKYEHETVETLISQVEEELDIGIGTVYVGDLLAICDVVLGRAALLLEDMLLRGQLHRPYPTDVLDADWAIIEPLLTQLQERPTEDSMREIWNTVQFKTIIQCGWSSIPTDLPQRAVVELYLLKWDEMRVFQQIEDALHTHKAERHNRLVQMQLIDNLLNDHASTFINLPVDQQRNDIVDEMLAQAFPNG